MSIDYGTVPRPIRIHHGTERDYLLWRLNRNYLGLDPGAPDYVGVRKTGKWEEAIA
jgi:hypothetical protein